MSTLQASAATVPTWIPPVNLDFFRRCVREAVINDLSRLGSLPTSLGFSHLVETRALRFDFTIPIRHPRLRDLIRIDAHWRKGDGLFYTDAAGDRLDLPAQQSLLEVTSRLFEQLDARSAALISESENIDDSIHQLSRMSRQLQLSLAGQKIPVTPRRHHSAPSSTMFEPPFDVYLSQRDQEVIRSLIEDFIYPSGLRDLSDFEVVSPEPALIGSERTDELVAAPLVSVSASLSGVRGNFYWDGTQLFTRKRDERSGSDVLAPLSRSR